MLNKYKKSHVVINLILTLLFIFLIYNLILFKQTSYLFCILSLLTTYLIIRLMYGYERKKRRYMYELMFYIFAFGLLILIISYLSGLFIGFTKSIYKLDISNLIHNIIPYLILIIITEVFRYEIVRKGDGSILSYILITIIFVLIDMTLFFTTYNLSIGDEQIKYVCVIILPSIFKNVILLFFARMGGPIPSMIYRIMFDLKLFLLPFAPNFGLYFEAIINCIIPVLIFGLVELSIRKDERTNEKNIDVRKSFVYRYLLITVLILLTIGFNLLGSGNFKYTMISIGSNSMSPLFSRGDSVIYKKYDNKMNLKIGDILVFKKNNKVVVHRIVETIDGGNDEIIYYTKGDANENPDGYPIQESNIIGKVIFKIKYIGIPSVIISERMK